MKVFLKFVSVILAAVLCIGCFTISSFAASSSAVTYSATPFVADAAHPNGTTNTYYVTKTIGGKTQTVKASKYPMVVSQDGYIVYYKSKTSNSVQIAMESPAGKEIAALKISGGKGYSDTLNIGFGVYVDRLWSSFVGEYAYYETKDCLYVMSKKGDVTNSTKFGTKSSVYWSAYRENVGKMSYAMGISSDYATNYFYIPETGKAYIEKFPSALKSGSKTYNKTLFGNLNYGTYVIITYVNANADFDIVGRPISENDCRYCIGNVSTAKTTSLYKSIETTDGKTFKVTDENGNKFNIDANGNKLISSQATTTSGSKTVAKPTYAVKGSAGVRKINLSTSTSGATIYYTTDGTTPTTKSKKYTNGSLLKLTKDTKIKAIAVSGSTTSAVMIKTFKVSTKYGDITGDGSINQNDYSRLKNYLSGKSSYICEDNADCDGNGKINENDLTVLKLYLDGKISSLPYKNSSSSSTSTSLPRPGITVYKALGGKRVEFTSSVSGVTYYYTLDGTTPTTKSKRYTGKFLIGNKGDWNVKVITYKNGETSPVQQTIVSVGQTEDVFAFFVNNSSSKNIYLACDTDDAIIYYTTDGSDPRTSSAAKRFTESFDIYPTKNRPVTVKAYARSKSNADSPVCSLVFEA